MSDPLHRELLALLRESSSADYGNEPEHTTRFLARVQDWVERHFATGQAVHRAASLRSDNGPRGLPPHEDYPAPLQQLRDRLAPNAAYEAPAHELTPYPHDERQSTAQHIAAAPCGNAEPDAPSLVGRDGRRTGEPADMLDLALTLLALFAEQRRCLADTQAELAAARARAEASDDLYRSLLAALPVGVVVQESDGQITLSNAAAERILGLTEAELAGRDSADPRWQAVDAEGRELPAERHPSMLALATGQPQRDVTMAVRKPDGTLVWLSVGADVLVSTQGDGRARVASSFMDITARKRSEQALGESQQQLNMVLERTGTGIWDWDLESGDVRFSSGWYTMLGFEPDAFPASLATWERLVHPDDRVSAWEAVNRMRASRDEAQPYDTVFRMRTQSGDWRWINARAAVVRRDAQGRPARVVGTHVDLTERRKFEHALHGEQEKLAGLFRIAPIGIAMAVDRVLVEVNDRFCALTGYRRDELVGHGTRLLYPDQAEYERVAHSKYQAGAGDSISEIETRWRRKDGRLIQVVLNATSLDCAEGTRAITLTVLDVTERRQIESALRASEEAYRLATEATQEGIWDWDIPSGSVQYSPAWVRLLALGQVPPHYDSWAERVHPEDWPEVERSLQEHLAGTGNLWQMEHRVGLPSGEWKWVLGRGRVVKRDPLGGPLRMVGTMMDISERKAAELERAVLSDTLEASLNEIYLFDAATFLFRYANEGARKNLGYSLETLRTLTPLDLKPRVTPAAFQGVLEPLQSGQRKVQVFESVHRRADGSLYPVEVHLQLFRHGGDGVYLAVIQDTTERKQAEAQLRASEERFRFWVEATDAVFWVADPAGALTEPSPSLERLTGLGLHEALGHGRLSAIHPDDREVYAASLAAAFASSETYEAQFRYWDTRAATYRWYLERGVPHRDDDGAIRGWLGAGVSIDRQKRAEAAQQDLLRRKDEFMAMLGHELRNPLTPIRNANALLGTRAGTDRTLVWVHGIIERHTNHLVRLVDDLLDVSRLLRGKIALQCAPIDVAALLRQIVDSHGPQIAASAHRLMLSVPDQTLPIDGDAVRLTQVFDNLIGNALNFTPEGGSIQLSAERAGCHVVIRVRDSGIGIPGDLLPHVFDAFAQGERALDRAEGGLGIGLTVARQLVELHGGEIEARSEGAGRGSEFIVRLPALEGMAGAESRADHLCGPAACVSHSGLRILVVDDNEDAASSLTLLLEYHGNAVEIAGDGRQALEKARRFRPDLVLLDIGLPGIDGFEVASRLRQLDEINSTYIVAVTGYAQPEYRLRARKAGFDGYLVKPIRLDEVRRLLDSVAAMSDAGRSRSE